MFKQHRDAFGKDYTTTERGIETQIDRELLKSRLTTFIQRMSSMVGTLTAHLDRITNRLGLNQTLHQRKYLSKHRPVPYLHKLPPHFIAYSKHVYWNKQIYVHLIYESGRCV